MIIKAKIVPAKINKKGVKRGLNTGAEFKVLPKKGNDPSTAVLTLENDLGI